MTTRQFLESLRARWIIAVVATVVCALASYAYSASQAKEYTATSKMFISLDAASSVNDLVQGTTYTQSLIASYTRLATLPIVLDPVIDELGLETTSTQLASSIAVTNPEGTMIIEIGVTNGSPSEAADIANAVAKSLGSAVVHLSPSAGKDAVHAEVVSPASPPNYPSAPRKKIATVAGALIGLALGLVIVALIPLVDTRVKTVDGLRRLVPQPILGRVPRRRVGPLSTVLTPSGDGHSPFTESYRHILANLQFIAATSPARVLVVTSTRPRDGKTTTAVELALALAEQKSHVLLVDADLRRPSVAEKLGLESAVGLSSVLAGRATFDDAVQQFGRHGLDVLTSGDLPPNPAQLLGSKEATATVARWRTAYDYVVLDSPPVLPVSDAAVLAVNSDGVIFVADLSRNKRPEIKEALEFLQGAGARVVGVVANRSGAESTKPYYGSSRRVGIWGRVRFRRRQADVIEQ